MSHNYEQKIAWFERELKRVRDHNARLETSLQTERDLRKRSEARQIETMHKVRALLKLVPESEAEAFDPTGLIRSGEWIRLY